MPDRGYRLRPYAAGDRTAVWKLLTRRLGLTARFFTLYWEWQLERNPFADEVTRHRQVVAAPDGKPVAFLATLPVPFLVDGKPHTFVCPMHCVADEAHPGVAVALTRQLFADNPFVYCNESPAEMQRIILARFLHRIALPRDRKYCLVPEPILGISYRLPRWLREWLATTVGPGGLRRAASRLAAVREVRAFPPAVEEWSVAGPGGCARIRPAKNARYLDWRYFSFPAPYYRGWVLEDGNRRGYLVLGQGNAPRFPLVLMDLQYNHEDALDLLLARALAELAAGTRRHLLAPFLPAAVADRLCALPGSRTKPVSLMGATSVSVLSSAFADPASWHLMHGDWEPGQYTGINW